MKEILTACAKLLALPAVFSVLFTSCNYKKVLDFPSTESIYLPAASIASTTNGLYIITATTEGQSYRYSINKGVNKIDIPLSVLRSGASASAGIPANIAINADTISRLIAAGKFNVPADPAITTELLPASAYSLPSSVVVSKDSSIASFALSIDLNFMTSSLTNFSKKRYAIGVGISNVNKSETPLNKLVIILIDPSTILLPVANFTTNIDNAYKTAGFVNISLNGVSYVWDFGDGTPTSAAVSTTHKYTASGTYNVTLSATGATGIITKKSVSISIL